MKKKIVALLAVSLFALAFVAAGSLSISSISFKDSVSNPVEKDYKVASYKIEGKNKPNASTISGQFTKTFDEIPFKLDNLTDGDNWTINVSAYDASGKLVGSTGDMTVAIKGSTSIDANIVVDVPSFNLDSAVVASKGEYVSIDTLYDIKGYKITLSNLDSEEEYVESVDTLPYNKALTSGRWSVKVEALDNNDNIIASSGYQTFRLGEIGSVSGKIALRVANTTLRMATSGTSSNNGYTYIEDQNAFSVKAFVSPLTKDDSVSYEWYVSKDGEWQLVDKVTSDTLTYDDVKDIIEQNSTFSILCNPVLNDKIYRGSSVTLSPIPELAPVLFVTGSDAITLDGKNSVDSVTTGETANFALYVPTYYLGTGLKAYYTTDGTKPTEKSEQLVLGKSVSINTGKSELKLLLVDQSGKNYEYTISLNIKSKASAPSVSITNRDRGKDLYATLSTRTEDAKIYYTLDGTEPTENSTEYTEPFKVGSLLTRSNTTIKAIAIKSGYENSNVTSVKSF